MESDKVLIHLRAAPNGTIVEIGERPEGLSPQEWFNFLSTNAGDAYQAFSGARGVFRLSRERVEQLKAQSRQSAA
jgi:hypothetical protein